jgi:hypothetical protein
VGKGSCRVPLTICAGEPALTYQAKVGCELSVSKPT